MVKSAFLSTNRTEANYLNGQLLIAMPGMRDPRFERSVILMCAHSEDGAMGIVVNQRSDSISFADLLEQLELGEDAGELDEELRDSFVHVGGPVETGRGFVLHSSDYYVPESTLPIGSNISLTATLDVLRAIAAGKGPKRSFLALGYAGWAPGQLEREIRNNGWLHCPATADIVFGGDVEDKYEQALAMLGIDPGFLAAESGHA
jgi:putative transcriptional regulator